MAEPAVCDEPLRLGERVREVRRTVHREHRREFFVRKFLRGVHARHFADQNLGVLGNLESRRLGDRYRLLTHDFRVQRTVDENRFARFLELFVIEEVAAGFGK